MTPNQAAARCAVEAGTSATVLSRRMAFHVAAVVGRTTTAVDPEGRLTPIVVVAVTSPDAPGKPKKLEEEEEEGNKVMQKRGWD